MSVILCVTRARTYTRKKKNEKNTTAKLVRGHGADFSLFFFFYIRAFSSDLRSAFACANDRIRAIAIFFFFYLPFRFVFINLPAHVFLLLLLFALLFFWCTVWWCNHYNIIVSVELKISTRILPSVKKASDSYTHFDRNFFEKIYPRFLHGVRDGVYARFNFDRVSITMLSSTAPCCNNTYIRGEMWNYYNMPIYNIIQVIKISCIT